MFLGFTRLIYEKAGISLGPRKEALVKARIGRRMRSLGIPTYRRYLDTVHNDSSGAELVEMLNAICTNVTSFFREETHFDFVKRVLVGWEAQGQKRFRFWCAAASTGEEPYSLAMTVRECLKDAGDALILATDLSTRALAAARCGVFKQKQMQNVPAIMMRKYFRREDAADANSYAVCDELRSMLRFGRINLATPPFPLRGPLDMVFCRNVMIYFDSSVRKRLLADVHRLVRPGGYLIVGHAESLTGLRTPFKPVSPSVYVKE